jgi:hypothetical protein
MAETVSMALARPGCDGIPLGKFVRAGVSRGSAIRDVRATDPGSPIGSVGVCVQANVGHIDSWATSPAVSRREAHTRSHPYGGLGDVHAAGSRCAAQSKGSEHRGQTRTRA